MSPAPDSPAPDVDVLVVGAGLSGLAAARAAAAAGASVRVLEADDDVGGRARTDEVDGFLLDRGFQVLLDAYPQARAQLDLEALDLRAFEPGAAIWDGRRIVRVADPIRRPGSILASLRSGVATPRDQLALVRLLRAVRRPLDPYDLLAGAAYPGTTELDVATALRTRYGFSERFTTRFAHPFFAGVLLDDELRSSSRMLEFVLRMFAAGSATLPAAGIGAIARQLADRLPTGSIELDTRVASVDSDGVTLEGGRRVTARSTVVAAGPWACRRLLGEEWGETDAVGTATLYFDAPRSPLRQRMLVLDGSGRGRGPVNELSVPSDVAPAYAPAGRSLVGASCVGVPTDDDEQLERAARAHLTRWFGPHVVNEWRLLRIMRIERALPDQSPPWLTMRDWPLEVRPGLYVAGDHRDTASIDGALRTGATAGRLASG
jgi:phytoene dehydrogenase-like protein